MRGGESNGEKDSHEMLGVVEIARDKSNLFFFRRKEYGCSIGFSTYWILNVRVVSIRGERQRGTQRDLVCGRTAKLSK